MSTPSKSIRITTSIPKHVKSTIKAAAELQGTNTSQFMVLAALQEAKKLLRDEQTFIQQEQAISMTAQDVGAFLESLENPPAPNDKLKRAAKRHRKATKRA